MRPLNLTSAPGVPLLNDLARSVQAGMLLVASTLPNGELRVVRPGNLGPSVARLYTQMGQFVDSVSWAAILGQKAIRASDFFASRGEARQAFQMRWLSRLGFAHAIVAPVASPSLSGYPGVLIALRGVGEADFTEAQLHALSDGARALDADASFSIDVRTARQSKAHNRLFVMAESGQFIGKSPMVSGLDRTLAANLEAFSKERVASGKPSSGGERVLLVDSNGEAHAFSAAYHGDYLALGKHPTLVMTAVPNYTEWLELKPEDFAADDEMGRLLPAFHFMMENYDDGVTLPAIAKHSHLSPFHFHRRFTDLFGITPKHFLYDCQIARAQQLLLEGAHELEEIAAMCGFAHQSHFTSRFKQATGLTPTRWRRLKLTGQRTASHPATARVGA